MYLRIGQRIINAAAMSHARVREEDGHTSVTISFMGDGGDRGLRLEGRDADAFLESLPVYRPASEEE